MQRSQGIPSFLCMNIWLKVRNNTLAPCHFNSSHFGLCVFYIATKTYLPNPATGQFSVTKLSLRLQPNEKRPNSQRENSWSQPFIRVPITGNRSEFRTTRTGQGRPQRLWQLCKGIWCKEYVLNPPTETAMTCSYCQYYEQPVLSSSLFGDTYPHLSSIY